VLGDEAGGEIGDARAIVGIARRLTVAAMRHGAGGQRAERA
jgi:hypothetical protein